MPRDIQNKDDIEILVNAFYDQVKTDPVIGFIFNRIIGDDWSHHLPVMYTFWNSVLFGAGGYTGNAVGKHVEIDKKIPLEQPHFDRWLALWRETVDSLFEGPNAETAKKKALLMLQLIQYKVAAHRSGKTII